MSGWLSDYSRMLQDYQHESYPIREIGGKINNMNANFLNKAGVNSIEDFYSKYPTIEHFYKKFPEMRMGGKVKKADSGVDMPGLTPPDPNTYKSTNPGLSAKDNEAGMNAAGPMGQQNIYQAQNQYKDYKQPGNRPGSGPDSQDGLADDGMDDNKTPATPDNENNPNPEGAAPTKPKQHSANFSANIGFNTADMFTGALSAIAGIIPNTPIKSNQAMYKDAYNPTANGTGSQAISKNGTKIPSYAKLEDGGSIPYEEGYGGDVDGYEEAKSGIHIKPENRGKFTAYKKRTGKTTEEALHSKDPHVRQMANFARNAKKWHHGKAADGTSIEQWNATHPDQAITRPMADYQQAFDYTPLGRSKVDNYGSGYTKIAPSSAPLTAQDKTNYNAFHADQFQHNPLYGTDAMNHNNQQGQLSTASSFMNYEYIHKDAHGNQIGYKAPSVTPMSKEEDYAWQEDNRTKSRNNGVPSESTPIVPSPTTPPPSSNPVVAQPSKFPTLEQSKAFGRQKQQGATGKWNSESGMYDIADNSNYNMHGGNSEEAAYGKSLNPSADGINVENNNYKFLSPHTLELGGYYHNEPYRPDGSGGTDVQYGNGIVEGQKGEPMSIGQDGSLNLFGKMYIPGTSTKFDTAVKSIGKQEAKADKLKVKGTKLVNESDPQNKYESLTFNTGSVMQDAYAQKQMMYDQQKEALASIQDSMHKTADKLGIEPEKLSGDLKAKYGLNIGKGSSKKMDFTQIARTMNDLPLAVGGKRMGGDDVFDQNDYDVKKSKPSSQSTKSKKTSSKPAPTKIDTPNPPEYESTLDYPYFKPITQASPNPVPYASDYRMPVQIDEVPISEPSFPRRNTEDVTPLDKVDVNSLLKPTTEDNNTNKDKGSKKFVPEKDHLRIGDLANQIRVMLEQPRPVPSFNVHSLLENPYSITMQNDRNLNQSTFNTAVKSNITNPAVQGAFYAQKYDADQKANDEEFKFNQGIFNNIMNQNYKTVNEDRRTNAGLDISQRDKQEQAYANTLRDSIIAGNSIADNYRELRKENFTRDMYNAAYHSQGVDKNGVPLHQDNAYIPGAYVPLTNPEDEASRQRTIKQYGYDPILKKKVSEVDEKTTVRYGGKIKSYDGSVMKKFIPSKS